MGSGGGCICPKCGHVEPHVPGTPCRELRCPQCGKIMVREGSYHHDLIEERKRKREEKAQQAQTSKDNDAPKSED